MARPQKESEIPDSAIQMLASICCTMTEISAVTGLSVDTLERRFAEPIKRGREIGKATLRREQYRLAMAGNPTMLIWLGKQLLGQADKIETAESDLREANLEGIPSPSAKIVRVN